MPQRTLEALLVEQRLAGRRRNGRQSLADVPVASHHFKTYLFDAAGRREHAQGEHQFAQRRAARAAAGVQRLEEELDVCLLEVDVPQDVLCLGGIALWHLGLLAVPVTLLETGDLLGNAS